MLTDAELTSLSFKDRKKLLYDVCAGELLDWFGDEEEIVIRIIQSTPSNQQKVLLNTIETESISLKDKNGNDVQRPLLVHLDQEFGDLYNANYAELMLVLMRQSFNQLTENDVIEILTAKDPKIFLWGSDKEGAEKYRTALDEAGKVAITTTIYDKYEDGTIKYHYQGEGRTRVFVPKWHTETDSPKNPLSDFVVLMKLGNKHGISKGLHIAPSFVMRYLSHQTYNAQAEKIIEISAQIVAVALSGGTLASGVVGFQASVAVIELVAGSGTLITELLQATDVMPDDVAINLKQIFMLAELGSFATLEFPIIMTKIPQTSLNFVKNVRNLASIGVDGLKMSKRTLEKLTKLADDISLKLVEAGYKIDNMSASGLQTAKINALENLIKVTKKIKNTPNLFQNQEFFLKFKVYATATIQQGEKRYGDFIGTFTNKKITTAIGVNKAVSRKGWAWAMGAAGQGFDGMTDATRWYLQSLNDADANAFFDLIYGEKLWDDFAEADNQLELVKAFCILKEAEETSLLDNIDELRKIADNLDEIGEAGGYVKWKSGLSGVETFVTVNGRRFISKKIGKKLTEVLVDADDDVVYYYLKNDISIPYAEFHLEGAVLTPSIELPADLRGLGIAKGSYLDAFTRLGGHNSISKMFSEWIGNSLMSDNFDGFRKALLNGDNFQDAAFLTPSGKIAKHLGFNKVQKLNETLVSSIKNGTLNEVELYFIKQ